MKKYLVPALVLSPIMLLGGCGVSTSTYTPVYTPAYTNDYVYSVGYYGYRPYYGNRYYTGYNWRDNYWTGNRYNGFYGRSWHARRW